VQKRVYCQFFSALDKKYLASDQWPLTYELRHFNTKLSNRGNVEL
jgi:hypothetical protein